MVTTRAARPHRRPVQVLWRSGAQDLERSDERAGPPGECEPEGRGRRADGSDRAGRAPAYGARRPGPHTQAAPYGRTIVTAAPGEARERRADERRRRGAPALDQPPRDARRPAGARAG